MTKATCRIEVALLVACNAACAATNSGAGSPPINDFDREAALATLREAATAARRCWTPSGPRGDFRIAVTFALDGHVTRSNVETNPFERVASDDDVRRCVERAFGEARVPPFHGAPVTVHKTFVLEQGEAR